ncbi:RES family NAD+ phosphorylase [Amycolatopsis rubida]|uniref:RES family NAD+ phosphorylase n=1 Tax=Amycolatopsis rubida TaxID=112413 RepID=A0ABX0BML5_9PSEU|nr:MULTISPECIES: RES family NAD+ phosphorylase [Amycolatopsis]MYW91626.1 RES domain-containing protein [Amycolatopsis rubida]NEC56611.1 RES family NAD+ phosphorylase [Amycolatopsis rubida]OAP25575.1 RES domain protein [Amycolatopsis sp. M39]
MARLPSPPARSALVKGLDRSHDVVSVQPETRLVRIFTAHGNHPQQWNTFRYTGPLPHGRFDQQPPGRGGRPVTDPGNGVLYFGLTVRTSVAEVFQTTSTVDRTTRGPRLVVVRPTRVLRLLDLTGLWPTRVGASQEISSGPKKITQAWARAIRGAMPDLDGLWYRSSMDAGKPSLCLWDPPAGAALPIAPDVLLPLDHPGLDVPLGRVCEELNYTLLS